MSVVIPTFNCAAYLAEAVRSALEQTHAPSEIIVVDDGSTDDTAAVVGAFGDAVTYVRQANSGVAAARNTGLRHAAGDFIAFLDADDCWAGNKLETQLAVMELRPDVDLVCADFWRHGDQARASYIRKKYRIFSVYERDLPTLFPSRLCLAGTDIDVWVGEVFGSLFLGNFINTSSVLLRRRAWERIGTFAETLRTQEDYDYWLRLARTTTFALVDRPLLAFRHRPDQLTAAGQKVRIAQDVLTVIEAALPHVGQLLPEALVARRMSERYAAVAIALMGARERSEGRRVLQRAFTYRPLWFFAGALMLWSFVPTAVGTALRKARSAARTVDMA